MAINSRLKDRNNHPNLVKDNILKTSTSVVNGNIEKLYTSIMPSRFDEEYYENFTLKRELSKKRTPLTFPITEDKNFEGEVVIDYRYIDYRNPDDFVFVHDRLSNKEREILTFVARFRNVQPYHIKKEFGNRFKNITQTLQHLCDLQLIQKFTFQRYDNKELIGHCYGILRNGLFLCRHLQYLSDKDMHFWNNEYYENDKQMAIRYWKICDTYQVLKMGQAFYAYNSKVTFSKTVHEFERQITETNKAGAKIKKNIKGTSTIPFTIIDGEVVMKKEDQQLSYYDIVPICGSSDIHNIEHYLKRWGYFNIEKPAEGENRYLLLVVDRADIINQINEKWKIDGFSPNILFLDLETAQYKSIAHSIFKYSRKNNRFGIVNFKLAGFEVNEND